MSIKVEKIIGPSPEQWKSAIRGMRNPMNSWEKSDSGELITTEGKSFDIGSADMELMKKLALAGSDHRKYLRMLPVMMDVTAPLYWWKEYDTYKVGTVANSCSTMHKIQSKPFVREDFSCDRMSDVALACLDHTIEVLEERRRKFVETKDTAFWDDMIQLLPSSYNQKRTLFLNYEVIWNMVQARKNHKLLEWREFCSDIIWSVPYFRDIFGVYMT